MWKIGLAIGTLGFLLGIGSFVLFGTAVSRAVSERQVGLEEIVPEREVEVGPFSVDPTLGVRVDVEAVVVLADELIDAPRDRGEILQVEVPVRYEVRDESGRTLHRGAGVATGSTIVPEQSSPHFDRFDGQITCRHSSQEFVTAESEVVMTSLRLDPTDNDGNPVSSGSVAVFDQLPGTAGNWAVGGLGLLVVGFGMGGIGFLLFVVGLVVRANRRPEPSH